MNGNRSIARLLLDAGAHPDVRLPLSWQYHFDGTLAYPGRPVLLETLIATLHG